MWMWPMAYKFLAPSPTCATDLGYTLRLHGGTKEDRIVEEAVTRHPERPEKRVVNEVDNASSAHVVDTCDERALLGGNGHLTSMTTEGPPHVLRRQHGHIALC